VISFVRLRMKIVLDPFGRINADEPIRFELERQAELRE
jgi:hypothetical protein